MTTGQLVGLIGGIAGCVLGLMGGLIGAWFSYKNAKGPKERRFVIKSSIVLFLGISSFLVLLFCLPSPYVQLIWIPYIILLPAAIVYISKKQRYLQLQESAEAKP